MSSVTRNKQRTPSPPERLTLTLIAEQMSELMAQAEMLVTDAATHILLAKRSTLKNVPYDRPMWVTRTYRHMRLNTHLKKITLAGVVGDIGLIKKNIHHIATLIDSINSGQHQLLSNGGEAKEFLSKGMGRLSLLSMKGEKQLARLNSKIAEQALAIETVPLSWETRQYFKGIETSTRRLVLISESIVCAIDCILGQRKIYRPIQLKEEDPLSTGNAELLEY